MGVITYSFNSNIPPKMSYGVLLCDIVMLQDFVIKDFLTKKHVTCAGPSVCSVLDDTLQSRGEDRGAGGRVYY